MPAQDAVIAITSETASMAGELNLIWDHLLPAMKDAPLPPDTQSQRALRQRLSSLELAPPKGRPAPPLSARISGKRFTIEPNSLGAASVAFRFHPHACTFTLEDAAGEHLVQCGLGRWMEGETDMPGTPPKLTSGPLGPWSKVAGGGAWRDDATFEMTWRFFETPHHDTVTCRFDGDRVAIDFMNSVSVNLPGRKETRPTLRGSLAA
jgi:hypothetical protein